MATQFCRIPILLNNICSSSGTIWSLQLQCLSKKGKEKHLDVKWHAQDCVSQTWQQSFDPWNFNSLLLLHTSTVFRNLQVQEGYLLSNCRPAFWASYQPQGNHDDQKEVRFSPHLRSFTWRKLHPVPNVHLHCLIILPRKHKQAFYRGKTTLVCS